jgi:Uma2 family endonuclease
MSGLTVALPRQSALPDHTQLPFEDDSVAKDFFEHPQSRLLTSTIEPWLNQRHPNHQYAIGQDSYIYWDITTPATLGAKAPDWFYVPDVPATLDGRWRKSYVLWQEHVLPVLVAEFVSGNGKEEHDATPRTGKFWVYEQGICARYYAIWQPAIPELKLFELVQGRFQQMTPNARRHYFHEPMGLELGLWQGSFAGCDQLWLRWWDAAGRLLPTPEERAEQEHKIALAAQQQAEQAHQQAEQAQLQAEQARREAEQAHQQAERSKLEKHKLADKLRELGIDPDSVA